ncbi:MAG: helix-turn-helix domain-containing protein [Bacteroidota bacterium]
MKSIINYSNKKDQVLAKTMLKSIVNSKTESKKIALNILGESNQFVLPNEASELIIALLKDIAKGNLSPAKLLSTQEASDLLGVSRPYLVKLLERDEIPFIKVGSHRRVSHDDVLSYKNKMVGKRNKQIKFLQKQAQELKLGYEE